MLLLAHRCALLFLFILSIGWSVGWLVGRPTGRSIGRSVGRWLLASVASAFLFVVYGHLTSQGPVIIRSCYLPGP